MNNIPIIKMLKWILIRRYKTAFLTRGFYSDRYSFASKKCTFGEFSRIVNGSILNNANIGRFSYASGAKIYNADIGAFCSIGPQAQVGGFGRHPTNFLSTHPVFYSKMGQVGITFTTKQRYRELLPVKIGNDVWIGARASILDGVEIGDGCIIAAGAVVTTNIPSYSIVGGVPAKLIRKRFSDELIQEILELHWWDRPIEVLSEAAPLFCKKSPWTHEDIRKIRSTLKNLKHH